MATWRQEVLQRAIEISATGVPEEGDFNTAMIQLRDIVPSSELALLQADLESVEAGSNVPEGWEEEEDPYWHDWCDDEDCPGCGNPPGFCDCEHRAGSREMERER